MTNEQIKEALSEIEIPSGPNLCVKTVTLILFQKSKLKLIFNPHFRKFEPKTHISRVTFYTYDTSNGQVSKARSFVAFPCSGIRTPVDKFIFIHEGKKDVLICNVRTPKFSLLSRHMIRSILPVIMNCMQDGYLIYLELLI